MFHLLICLGWSSDVLGESSQGEPVSSKLSVFSISEDSIHQFMEEEMELSPGPSSSPSISSFPNSADASQSILQNCTIVSSDPTAVEQIQTTRSNVAGPKEASVSTNSNVGNNNVAGPKVTRASNSKVAGPKVAKVSNNSVSGPKVAGSNSFNSSLKGEPTLLKFNFSVSLWCCYRFGLRF